MEEIRILFRRNPYLFQQTKEWRISILTLLRRHCWKANDRRASTIFHELFNTENSEYYQVESFIVNGTTNSIDISVIKFIFHYNLNDYSYEKQVNEAIFRASKIEQSGSFTRCQRTPIIGFVFFSVLLDWFSTSISRKSFLLASIDYSFRVRSPFVAHSHNLLQQQQSCQTPS